MKNVSCERRSRARWSVVSIVRSLLVLIVCALTAPRASAAPVSLTSERATVRGNQLTVTLRDSEVAANKLKVLSREGGGALSPLPNAVKTSAGAPTQVTIPADRPVFVKVAKPAGSGPASAPALPTKPTELSGVLLDSVPVPGTKTERAIHQWTLVLQAEQVPLPWNGKAYSTKLIVGLRDAASAGLSTQLTSPVVVQLLGDRAAISPARIELAISGVAGFVNAVVTLPNHNSKATVTALSDFGEETYAVGAAPELATLDLEASLTSIPGFGIGTSTISVVRRAEDGLELLAAQPTTIALSASSGRLDKPVLALPTNSARGSLMLRSAWLGEATLVAKTDSYVTQPLKITFTTPWSYLLAIALGALLGAYVSVRFNGKGVQSPEFLAGAGVGLILAVASFVGVTSLVQLPAAAVVTEAGSFVIAAIEAYAGRAALDRFTKAEPPNDKPKG